MASVTMSGFNGYDFGSIIDSIMKQESQPLTALQDQQTALQNKDSALVQLNNYIGDLQTQSKALSQTSEFENVTAVSSDTSVATATAGSGALEGRYDVSITALAKGQVTSSTNGYTALDNVAADGGSLSFTINGTTTASIDISSATTLSQLKDSINQQSSGVVASLVNTGSSYKLVISSRTTGLTNGFAINNSLTNGVGTAVAFAAGQSPTSGNNQDARNSDFTVNGLQIQSASNDVTDAIPGMTLGLVTTGDAVVNVAPDYGSIKDALKSIVTTYNKLRLFKQQQSGTDASGNRAPLAGDSVMRETMSDLRDVMLTANNNGGKFKYLSEIGLQITATGDLKYDDTAFTTASASPTDIQKLFQGTTSITGVFDNMKTKLDSLDGTTGLIKSTRASIDLSVKGLRDRILSQQMRLDQRKQDLQAQYAAADEAMSKLNSMSGQISALGR